MTAKRTRCLEFLDEMEKVAPWADLVALVSTYLPEGKRGRSPFWPETILRTHLIQQWFVSDPAMEEALHAMSVFREFAGLGGWVERLPDENTIWRFLHMFEKHKLAAQILQTENILLSASGVTLKTSTVVATSLIAAPSSTKNSSADRDPEMKQCRKGLHLYFGMKCYVGIESGMVQTVKGTSGAVFKANSLVRPSDREVYADTGYQIAGNRPDSRGDTPLSIAMRPGTRPVLNLARTMDALTDQMERVMAGSRARVEDPFHVLKRHCGHANVRYRGLGKNTAQLQTLFALPNLWMVRRKLLGVLV